MAERDWIKEFPGIILVCDETGVLIEMNDRAIRAFADQGGASLLGRSVLDCHSEANRDKIKRMLSTGRKNIYFSESHGVRKLICQVPWTRNGVFRGFVELCLEV